MTLGAKIRPDLDSDADELHRSKMAACRIPLRTCVQETIKCVSDEGSDADVDLISALSDHRSDVCLVSGEENVS